MIRTKPNKLADKRNDLKALRQAEKKLASLPREGLSADMKNTYDQKMLELMKLQEQSR